MNVSVSARDDPITVHTESPITDGLVLLLLALNGTSCVTWDRSQGGIKLRLERQFGRLCPDLKAV